MNNPFGLWLTSLTGTFAWALLWQSTLWLALGLVVGRIWRRRAARAHLVLVLATVAAVASPLLTAGVRGLGWGVLQAAAHQVVEVPVDDAPPVATESRVTEPPAERDLPVAQEAAAEAEMPADDRVAESSSPPAVAESIPETMVPAQTTRPWTTRLGNSLPVAIVCAWIVCSLALFIHLMSSLLAGRRLVRQSVREVDPELLTALSEARGLLAVDSVVDLRASTGARCPMIWCWANRPVLLVPPSAGDQEGISWCSIFCHELAHWLRSDHLSAFWTELLVIAVPWQPLAWFSRRQLSALREQACDDWVLASVREATDYAESLVNLVPQNSPTFALPALRSYESLKHRLEHVLAGVRVTPRAGRNWVVLASLLSLVAAAGIAFAQQRAAAINTKVDEALSATTTAADRTSDNTLLPAREERGDDFTVRGRVFKPNGEPAGGARVAIVRFFFRPIPTGPKSAIVTTGTASPDGRFTLTYHPSQIVEGVGRIDPGRETTVLAEADGFGLQWAEWQDIVADKPLRLTLTADAPIHGRVVDLEGRPVSGVAVVVNQIRGAANATLDPWLAAVKSGADAHTAWQSMKLAMIPYKRDESKPVLTTGPDGRFVLSGIGPERVLDLTVTGDTIADSRFRVVTRPMAPITQYLRAGSFPVTEPVYGNDFTLQAYPSRPVVGIVRDAATGKPLPGVTVAGDIFAGKWLIGIRDVLSQTDAEGRFRIAGMPKGKRNEIVALPNDDQPYLMRRIVVPDDPGAGPVTVDIELHRGIWIKGRVLDKATGKPALARLHYYPFRNNAFASALPEYQDGQKVGNQFRYRTKPDGSFQLVGLPGRAIVGAAALGDLYKGGVGANEIKGLDKNGVFPTFGDVVSPGLKWPNTIKEINPPREAAIVRCDLALERGDAIHVTAIDRESKPVAGCFVSGRTGGFDAATQATFDLENFSPNETRPIVIEQKERGIGKFLLLKFDEKTPRTMSVTLEPSATLVGRLLDADGVPLGGVHVTASPLPGGNFWPRLESVICSADGSFKYTGLVPGCDYYVFAEAAKLQFRELVKRLKIEPGKVIDLGDIKLKRDSIQTAAAEPAGSKESQATAVKERVRRVVLRGCVLKPDGQPAQGAAVRAVKAKVDWFKGKRTEYASLANTVTDSKGEFTAPIEGGIPGVGRESIALWTTLRGYGLAVHALTADEDHSHITLQLVEDETIHGRIIDLEGRPASNARVQVAELADCSKEAVDDWLAAMKAKPSYSRFVPDDGKARSKRAVSAEAVLRVKSVVNVPGMLVPPVTTDGDGQFAIKGLGRDRHVDLLLSHPGMAAMTVQLLTRPIAGLRYESQETLGSRVDRVVTPSVPVEGTVTDEETGSPIAGAVIVPAHIKLPGHVQQIDPFLSALAATTSDASGHYRIEGLRTEAENWIRVFVPDSPYLDAPRVTVPPSSALAPIRHPIKLRKGVLLLGRAFNRVTGKGVPGEAYYTPFRTNKTAEKYPHYRSEFLNFLGNSMGGRVDSDGYFRIPVIPGRGVVCLLATDGVYRLDFGRAQIKEFADRRARRSLSDSPTYEIVQPMRYHAIREINVPSGAAETSIELPVDPGQDVRLKFVDAQGRALSGLETYGLSLGWRNIPGRGKADVAADSAVVTATSVDETRIMWFKHRATGLTKLVHFTPKAGETERTIVLEPPAVVTGRLVTPEGRPIGNEALECVFDENSSERLPAVKTDSDGKFRYELPAGGPLQLYSSPFPYAWITDHLYVNSGEQVDFGSITIERKEKQVRMPKVTRGPEKRNQTRPTSPPLTKAAQSIRQPILEMARSGEPRASGRVVDEMHRPIAGAHLAAMLKRDDARPAGDSSLSSKTRDHSIVIRGQVLRPDRQPAVGAEVFALYQPGADLRPGRRLAVTRTDANGSYQLAFRKPDSTSDIVLYGNPGIWASKTCVIASHVGFGPDSACLGKINATKPVNLQLVPDTLIQGRLVDLEGRPVVGATVKNRGTWICSTAELTRYLAATRSGLYAGNSFSKFIPPYDRAAVTTDADGRFQIAGVGKDRRLLLAIRGETIAYTELTVVTQDIQPMDERIWPDINLTETRRLVGPSFTVTVPPTRVISGLVRDSRDGKPLAGVRITSDKFPGVRISGIRTVSTTSDREGHFRLVGMPKGSGTVIDVFPEGRPYFPRAIKVPDKVGGEPIALDIDLHRGIWITGRVTDKLDGSPQLARITYFPLRTNPYAAKLSEFVDQEFPAGPGTDAAASGADGTYRILGVPGPALIGAWTTSGDFRRGVGFDELKTVKPDSDGRLRNVVFSNGAPGPSRKWPNVVKEVTFPEEPQPAVCDLTLDPGESVQISVFDADRKPATGYEVDGRTPNNRYAPPLQESTFRVVGLSPGEKRIVLIHDAKRHIGKGLTIDFGPQTPRSIDVQLEPCATIVGRGVDGDGLPVGGVRLELLVRPVGDYATFVRGEAAGADGRFRHEGILPGVDYQLNLNYGFIPKLVRRSLSVKPGETIDLGDVKVSRTN